MLEDTPMEADKIIAEAARLIESADALIVLAGAGMGVDSGLPDYRGDEGLWREYPILKELRLSFEEVANPRLFETDPNLAWEFYGHRQELYRDTPPHAGYSLLKAWGEAMPDGHFVFTSNVDGHFQFAGFAQDRLVECHGNIHRIQCCGPCHDGIWQESPDSRDTQPANSRYPIRYCPECNEPARPNVMMFGDWDWNRETTERQQERYNHWAQSLQAKGARVVVIEIGAGTTLPAIRRETESIMQRLNARLIRINTREPEGPSGTVSIGLPALEALKKIDQMLTETFTNRCAKPELEPDKPVGQRSLFDRFNAFFKSNPGGVISTRPHDELGVIKARKVYAKPCHVTLSNGWIGWVSRFEMQSVYAGQIEGLPERSHIQQTISKATDYMRGQWHASRIKVLEPKIYAANTERPLLPQLQLMARIECHERRNEQEDRTWLHLIWFADIDDDKSVRDYVADALTQVNWEQDAESYCI